jgi:hypothetical protein
VRVMPVSRTCPSPRVRAAPISTRPAASAWTSRFNAEATRSVSAAVCAAVIRTANLLPGGTPRLATCWDHYPSQPIASYDQVGVT